MVVSCPNWVTTVFRIVHIRGTKLSDGSTTITRLAFGGLEISGCTSMQPV